MVRDPGVEPSTLRLDITDGPYLRSEPSTLKADIVDGSTIKAEPSLVSMLTFHAIFPVPRTVHSPELNLPR